MDKKTDIIDNPQSESAYWGTVLEDVIAKEFQKRTALSVRKRNAILGHPQHNWAFANVDRLIHCQKRGTGILEVKTASEYLKSEWEGNEVPASYLLQVQWYFFVTGLEWGYFAALIGGNKFVMKEIHRDEQLINYMFQTASAFWHDNILKDVPPEFDGSEASSKLLKEMYPYAEDEENVALPQETDGYLSALDHVNKELDQLKKLKTNYENKVKSQIKSSSFGSTSNYIVSHKNVTSKRIDSKKLKEDFPDVYEQVTKDSSYRKFTFKEKGE